MSERNRKSTWGRLVDDIRVAASAPDFWPMLGLFVGFLLAFGFFFWFAIGFDGLSHIYRSWQGACRKLGDLQAFVLFVSPFAIGLSSLAAAGEFISQLERRNKYGKPMRWGKIMSAFALALGLLIIVAVLMMVWC